ncbi:SRPBCC family protein [Arenibaculum sp.]|jgi:uncharacterized membrane protein|uniref:SRPBCC family protein n=1 Tax=Arenibaculum sp. TaxID=2865862 RepID=UPI002E131C3C|nr:SRPBCC family protein [Arenibaculum sp.]
MTYSFTNSGARRATERLERATKTDIETLSRYALIAGGSLMALGGMRRGGLSGAAMAAAGMGLIWRGSARDPLMTGVGGHHDHVAGVDERHHPVTITHAVTIGKPRDELYRFWRDFENLPRFMEDVERIDVTDRHHSHWCVRSPGEGTVEWDAEVHDEREGEHISWRSVGEAEIHNSGIVRFRDAPGGRGTVVEVTLRYEPPFGRLGRTLAKLTGHEPEVQLRSNLRRLKQIMETGEVATSRANPAKSIASGPTDRGRDAGGASSAGSAGNPTNSTGKVG